MANFSLDKTLGLANGMHCSNKRKMMTKVPSKFAAKDKKCKKVPQADGA